MTRSSLLIGENASFIDSLYVEWQQNPDSVDAQWQELFAEWQREEGKISPSPVAKKSIFAGVSSSSMASVDVGNVALRQAKVAQMINAFRVRGHTESAIDPLGRRIIQPHPELNPTYYGFTDAELDAPVSGHGVFGVPEITTARTIVQRLRKSYCGGFGVEFMNINDPVKRRWLQEKMETLPDKTILSVDDQKHMLRNLADSENFEKFLHQQYQYTKRFSLEGAETLVPLLAVIIDSLATRGAKRVMLGMAHRGRLNVLANICNKPVQYILNEFNDEVLGSFDISGDVKYHLGYSDDYVTVHNQKVRVTMAFNPSHLEAVDPVVLGRARARQDKLQEDGMDKTTAQKTVVPLLIHGDAAVAGQGVVAEVLNMGGLEGYTTGGTVHVVVNNQIGFTTSPSDARSTPYCTDVARMLAVPIFHVNGENMDAVAAVAKIAAEWRQTFHQDVFIDMYCFRKWGHNEGDEPSFTQPLLYDVIRNHPSPKDAYVKSIVSSGFLTQEEVDAIVRDSADRLQQCLKDKEEQSKEPKKDKISFDTYTSAGSSQLKHRWQLCNKRDASDAIETAVDSERLSTLLKRANDIPDSVQIHKKVSRILSQRVEMVEGLVPVDWALAEQAAYATLVQDGFRVRISGQDCGRGTFSHRHAVLTDIHTGVEYLPLANLGTTSTATPSDKILMGPAARVAASQHNKSASELQGSGPGGRITVADVLASNPTKTAKFEVFNSLLSEYAVLGFEHGYTLDYPEGLVIWEAQFGDFANGAQIMIDNFIMAAEQKWNRFSGLVMLLPHGYEGQGPEHSSARLERFLQLCAEDNVTVANISTPANLFHLLRRQMHREIRRPLVVMSPKSLLRHPKCVSTMEDMSSGKFQKIIVDPRPLETSNVRNLVFCSGKIYYDLVEHQEMIDAYQGIGVAEQTKEQTKEQASTYLQKFCSNNILAKLEGGEKIDTGSVAFVRVEQLYPFPAEEIASYLAQYPNASVHWCQEEPRNMGAWPMFDEWFGQVVAPRSLQYIGRKSSASPATGSPKIHKAEQAKIVDKVFGL